MKKILLPSCRLLVLVFIFGLLSTNFSIAQTSASNQLPIDRNDLLQLAESINRLSKLSIGISGDVITEEISAEIQTICDSSHQEQNINKIYAQTYLMQARLAGGVNYLPSMVMLYTDEDGIAAAAFSGSSALDSAYLKLKQNDFSDELALVDFAMMSDVYMSLFSELLVKWYGMDYTPPTALRLEYEVTQLLNEATPLSSPATTLQHALAAEAVMFYHTYLSPIHLYSTEENYLDLFTEAGFYFDEAFNLYNNQIPSSDSIVAMSEEDFSKYMHQSMQYRIQFVDMLYDTWSAFIQAGNPTMMQQFTGLSEEAPKNPTQPTIMPEGSPYKSYDLQMQLLQGEVDSVSIFIYEQPLDSTAEGVLLHASNYDENGYLTSFVFFDNEYADILLERDTLGRLMHVEDNDLGFDFEWKYDDSGYVVFMYTDESDFVSEYRYDYNDNHELIQTKRSCFGPDPMDYTYTYSNYQYDEHGNWISRDVFYTMDIGDYLKEGVVIYHEEGTYKQVREIKYRQ